MLLLLVAGSGVSSTLHDFSVEYSKFVRYYKLGAGAFVWCILCVLGGAFGLYQTACKK